MHTAVQHAWQHAVVRADTLRELEGILDERGAEGWELVNVVHNEVRETARPVKTRRTTHTADWYAFFKRPA
jgi:hypothetical protein